MRKVLLPLAASVLLALSGCASVKVMKVQVKDGEKEPEGFPFYLPRPYVQVYEPFVISSKVYLAAGQLSPDGQFLLLDNVNNDLDGVLAADMTRERDVRFPMADVRVTTPQGLTGRPQSGVATSESDNKAGTGTKTDAAEGKKDDQKIEEKKGDDAGGGGSNATSAAPVGQFNTSVTQSLTPFPSTLGRRFFDVVWMPDFDEKYVVQGQPGLGNANIGVAMVQGWGLYGLDARIDNSAIVKPLLDFYSTGLDALSKLAKSKILPAPALAGAPQSGEADAKGRPKQQTLTPGTRVSVKITKVSVAAPGLYPVLKPKEASQVTAEATRSDSPNARVLVPMRPYTNVAFNVYDVLVVEAAKPTGDSPMNLQRYFDIDAQGNAVATPPAPNQGTNTSFDAAEYTTRINNLLVNEKGADGGFWVISDVKAEGNRLKVTATLTGGKQKPTKYSTSNALKQLLSIQSKKFAVTDIDVAEK